MISLISSFSLKLYLNLLSSRKSSGIFGNFRKMFWNVRLAFGTILGNLRKVVKNLRKIVRNAVISMSTAVSRKVLQKGNYATMSKVVTSNGSFYGCLIEPQGVSAWWKETAQTRVFMLSCSLLLNHLEPQSSKTKLLQPIIPVGIVACAFTLY